MSQYTSGSNDHIFLRYFIYWLIVFKKLYATNCKTISFFKNLVGLQKDDGIWTENSVETLVLLATKADIMYITNVIHFSTMLEKVEVLVTEVLVRRP